MDRYEWKGDFLGFTYGGVHSSSLGIVRTSDGSRYSDNLLPEFEDKTVKVPGRDETYYFGSEYKQRTFEIKIAFDHMTEKQLRQLRQLLSGQELKDLIFDEAPYKVYKVKATGSPNLTYLAFTEDCQRIYKGEGTLSFIAYYPFARSRYKYLEDYNAHNIPEWSGVFDNKREWIESSGIISKESVITIAEKEFKIDSDSPTFSNSEHTIYIHNPGDLNTDFEVIFNHKISLNINEISYYISLNKLGKKTGSYISLTLTSKEMEKIKEDYSELKIIINSYNYSCTLIKIKENGEEEKELRNDLISGGDFFKIPPASFFDRVNFFIKTPENEEVSLNYNYIYY